MKPPLTTVRKFTDSLAFMELPVFSYIDRNDFAIVKMEELGMPLPYQTPVFRPDHFSIIIIPDGVASYRVDDTVFKLCANHVLFIRPDTFLSSKWSSLGKAYYISFSNHFLLHYWPAGIDEIQKMGNKKGYAAWFEPNMIENMERICLDMYDEAVCKTPYKYEVIANLILNLLLLIRQQQYTEKPVKAKKHNCYVAAFLGQMENNFSRIISGETTRVLRIKDYADMQNLNEGYLSKIVSSTTGKTVNQWIHEKLINEIKYLLKNTNKPMREIATLYGFNDLNYFYNYFKRHTNNAPGYFRRDCNAMAKPGTDYRNIVVNV